MPKAPSLPSNEALTAKQEAFARALANGANYGDAYRLVYATSSQPKNFHRLAGMRVARLPKVATLIREIKARACYADTLERAQKRKLLRKIAEDTRAKPMDRLRAIDLDNRMTNDYQQTVRVEGEVTISAILASLRGTTGLLSEEERKELDPAHVIAAVQDKPAIDAGELERHRPSEPLRGPLECDLDDFESLAESPEPHFHDAGRVRLHDDCLPPQL